MFERAETMGLRVWRRLTQAAFLILIGQWSFYGVFRCPFIVPYVSCQNCPVLTCHGRLFHMFWGFWIALPLSLLVFGRCFCGWACPGGLAVQLLGKPAPFKLRVKNAFTRLAPWLKFAATAGAMYVWLIWGQPREAIPIRTGGFFSSVALTFEHAGLLWLIRTFFVLGVLALGLVAAGAWCRFACPTGGALEALKRFSLFKVYKTHECNDCDKCLAVCEMGTRPAERDCVNCCDCLSVCPQNAIKTGIPRMKK
ncbi:4Fe-4S ferredoxin [Candidatus Desulfarcum epimagneticum]|uniref:4Fe-4S ferredoxin n=1 Tax=uncultured Desulfobacteraceae bacterium TaxID=218296 RepID=A0A484HLF5_9BACT|nr:4Fe-4S ferredoxin [uncultured Desulfobacteraceae bacterium]